MVKSKPINQSIKPAFGFEESHSFYVASGAIGPAVDILDRLKVELVMISDNINPDPAIRGGNR